MKEAKHLGVDMFLLDDGWFGNKHPRNSDNAGLGDWEVMKSKLPGRYSRTREVCQRSRSKIRYLDRTGDDKPQKVNCSRSILTGLSHCPIVLKSILLP